jgi:pimeloyl-ACP methyl ester carboxylesterase
MALCISLLLVATAAARGQDTRDGVISLPLDNGRLPLREIIRPIAEQFGIEDLAPLDRVDRSIDVRSFVGRAQIAAIERLSGGAVEFDVKPDALELRLEETRLAATVRERSQSLERWLADLFKYDRARTADGRFGLTFITADDARGRVEALTPAMRERIVVLVHGLDDPGMMWTDLIPALHAAGFTVARFEYPNDGPIAEGADRLAADLQALRAAGVSRLDIVAHSMGGLVVRDALTRSTYYAGDGAGGERYPAVDHFIMCGTPNHGSELARLRSLVELREHLFTAMTGKADYRELAAGDGHGEAGRDLLPDSDFLRRLNARPLPAHTQFTIIAGRLSAIDGSKVKWLVGKARSLASSEVAPSWLRDSAGKPLVKAAEDLADDAVEGLGDGVLSIRSSKLEGVDDWQMVRASHIGMLLNLGGNGRQPPAIPIILDRLGAPSKSDDQ